MSTLHRSFVGIDMRTKKYRKSGVAALVMAGLSMPLMGGWLVQAAANPAPSRDVGYIERIVGDLKNIRIDRHGQSVQPAILLPLRVDDRVVLKRGSELYLQLGNRRVVITEKDSPYRVPMVDAPPAFLTRLRSKYETSAVPGKFFEMPDHFRIGMGVNTEMFGEGLHRIGMALDEL